MVFNHCHPNSLEQHPTFRPAIPTLACRKKTVVGRHLTSTSNCKQAVLYGCFNWMIQSLYMGNGCFTKHPLKTACLELQKYKIYDQIIDSLPRICTKSFLFIRSSNLSSDQNPGHLLYIGVPPNYVNYNQPLHGSQKTY